MKKRQKEILGLVLIILSFLAIVSLIGHDPTENPQISSEFKINNPLGYFGVFISYYLFLTLGYTSIIFPLIFILIGYSLFTNKNINKYYKDIIYIILSGVWVSLFIAYLSSIGENNFDNYSGALIGYPLYHLFKDFLGFYGITILLITTFITAFCDEIPKITCSFTEYNHF